MSRRSRRLERDRVRHRIVAKAAAVAAVTAGLAWSAVTFAPLAAETAPDPVVVTPTPPPSEPDLSEPLDAYGATSAGLTMLFDWLDAYNAWYLVRDITPSVDHWLRIGRCEQPGSGYGGVDWQAWGSNWLSSFGGGLGIMRQAWIEWGGQEFAPTAPQASPFDQMRLASRIYRAVGPGAWSCK